MRLGADGKEYVNLSGDKNLTVGDLFDKTSEWEKLHI
jgi:hypothetical protein